MLTRWAFGKMLWSGVDFGQWPIPCRVQTGHSVLYSWTLDTEQRPPLLSSVHHMGGEGSTLCSQDGHLGKGRGVKSGQQTGHSVIFMDSGQGTEGLTESSPVQLELPNNRRPRKSLGYSRMQEIETIVENFGEKNSQFSRLFVATSTTNKGNVYRSINFIE